MLLIEYTRLSSSDKYSSVICDIYVDLRTLCGKDMFSTIGREGGREAVCVGVRVQ